MAIGHKRRIVDSDIQRRRPFKRCGDELEYWKLEADNALQHKHNHAPALVKQTLSAETPQTTVNFA
jgi:hypothetical protein